ncbi:MAG: DegV family protein, partial [Coriobacteriia bacterium]|nr:DegV family protein [Coriobacteriia bacterium]
GIAVVPLKTIFGHCEYRDGIDLGIEEFYDKLAGSDELPSTSQPTPHDFEQVFAEALDAGDEIIAITLAESISGTYQSAIIAREKLGADFPIIDSENATLGLQILVRRALELRDAGHTTDEIARILEQEKRSIRLFAAFDTLDYLLKGGRLSKASAVAGTLMNVKPVIALVGGELEMVGKYRGNSKAYENILKFVEGEGGIDLARPFAIGYTGDRSALDNFEKIMRPSFGDHEPLVGSIGSVIGTHAGPGAVTVAFFRNS